MCIPDNCKKRRDNVAYSDNDKDLGRTSLKRHNSWDSLSIESGVIDNAPGVAGTTVEETIL
jgi:hypothetical protein